MAAAGLCAAASGIASNRVTVGADVFMAPGGSYLFANSNAYSGGVTPDETYGTGFTDFLTTNSSGIHIVDAGGVVRNGVGSPTSPCREGNGILTPASNTDSAFERVSGTQDTDDNPADFQDPKPGDPQNSGGNTTGEPPVMGLRIRDIQGRQHLSPYRGSFVLAIPGVVTARRFNGFYFQDPQPDDDEAPPRACSSSQGVRRRRPRRWARRYLSTAALLNSAPAALPPAPHRTSPRATSGRPPSRTCRLLRSTVPR